MPMPSFVSRSGLAGLLLAATWLAGCATAPPAAPVSAPVSAPLTAPVLAPPSAAVEAAGAAPAAAPVAVQIVPPLPRARLDPRQDAERHDLWQRVRDGYALPELDHALVRKWEQYYAGQPDYMQRMTERGGRYLFHIVEEIDRRGMPLDLALLPFIESAFNPQATSRAAASGMWQFMPGTGRDFKLRQNVFRDDRRDVLASTHAALDYLQRLYTRFGNWHLALAAYNWGQGNVQRAIDANVRSRAGTDYLSLTMPDETRNYVPKLQAMKNIVARPQDFQVRLPALDNHPFFTSVAIDQDIDVSLVMRLAGLGSEEFHQLNPQLNKPVILAAGTPRVLLPYDHANRFVQELKTYRGPRASWTAWVAPRTLKTTDAARLVGMPEADLREVNRIPERMVVKAGSTLLVTRAAHTAADVSGHVADNASIALAPEARPPRRTTVHASRRGDTVAALARRYGMPAAQLARLNGVAVTGRFAPGQAVQVESRGSGGALAPSSRTAARSTARQVSHAKRPVRVAAAHARRVR